MAPTGRWGLFRAPQNWAYDHALELRQPLDTSHVIIVGIDEVGLADSHLGRFPWPRRVYAELLPHLAQARAVGFDLLFGDPDTADPASDLDFARALRRNGRSVLAMHVARQVEVGKGRSTTPGVALPRVDLPFRPWVVKAVQVAPPMKLFADAAAGVGSVALMPDADGIFRRTPLVIADTDGNTYPDFALELARVATGMSRADLARRLASRHVGLFGQDLVPGADGNLLIDYPGPSGAIPRVSLWDVLQGRVKPQVFAGRVAIIGAVAPALGDVRPAPYAMRAHFYLGVETNAAICNMLLGGTALTDASRSVPWLLLGGLLATAVALLIWLPAQSLLGIPAAAAVLALEAVGFYGAFDLARVVLPLGPVALMTGVVGAWSAWRRVGIERAVVRDEFSAYVSPEVLSELLRNPEVLERGERREVTLLFSDIRSSTALAEKVAPEQWIAQLNEYLTSMAEAVLDAQGYLDKFTGDGLMAVWNGFGDQPHHADLAVAAAMSMLRRLGALNAEWAGRPDRVELRIGIGVHTGEAILGNVGSVERTQFTAIGDTVNAASRIEGATKELGVQFVVSEATAGRLLQKLALKPLGEAALRGRVEPVRLFGLSEVEEGAMDAAPEEEAKAQD